MELNLSFKIRVGFWEATTTQTRYTVFFWCGMSAWELILKFPTILREWNFVHPNSANSKLNLIKNSEPAEKPDESKSVIAKYINADSISKILFTHMASFIVGATL